ncbi:uncharacterized protein LOC100121217 isoform X1 [Nasonia vitripennis]|uniref:Serpin domain-containing protein n=1 Tax=Nasonia vitripennis TaxID=7425 RepID=A0A7M7H3Z8_NASVI|nr:uncharacterized protein LOC100121217 isoform X1 [Nasonia vitripennis]
MVGYVSWICGVFVAGCILQPPSPPVHAHYHNPYHQQQFQPWHRHRPAPIPRRPVDLMTDVINDLGTRVLQQYIEPGNVAFSPAGMGFILAALYEGSTGHSRQQIVDCLGLPRDRNVVRVGMRDIHRRLRTYLNPDGFLGGLNLNRENTTLRPDYENILRFYGFDLSIDLSNFTADNTGNFGLRGSSTTNIPPMTSQTQMATTPPPGSTMMPNGAAAGQTLAPTTVPPAMNGGMAAGTTMPPTTQAPADMTTIDTSVVLVSTTLAGVQTTLPPAAQTATTGAPTSTMATGAAQAASTIMTSRLATSTTMLPTTMPPTTTMAANAALISTTLPRLPPSAPSNRAFLTAGETTSTDLPTTTTTMPTTTSMLSSDLRAETTTNAEDIATVAAPTTIPALIRRRRSRRRRRSNEGYFSNYPDDGLWMQDLDIWAEQPVLPTNERDATDLQFLVNGCDLATVPAATYTTVLPFAYFPSLKAVALEFPLDNPRYNVLLFMPTERIDTSRLSRELAGQNLRLLRRQLQPTWLRATIPSFMLRGFVTLTPYLQRLGIRDVFEPRMADLGPMTPDLGVYARDVQQSIAVNIRNYMKPDPNAMNVNPSNNPNINMRPNPSNMGQNGNMPAGQMPQAPRPPPPEDPPVYVPPPRDAYRFSRPVNGVDSEHPSIVPFTAEHPFLFFIIDSETSVALIAGRIDDPLNSRIL